MAGKMKTVASMSIDAFTATSRSAEAAEKMLELGWRAVAQEERLGNIRHDVNMHGYKGARAGQASCAQHDNGQVLVRWMGSTADAWCKGLSGQAINVTRIDLQITFKVGKPSVSFGKTQADAAHKKQREVGGEHWPKMRHENGYGDGDTVYIGKRVSAKFGRLYDKGRQSKDRVLADHWRAEVEYKDDVAPRVWDSLVKAAFAPLHAYSIVATQFKDWQFNLPIFDAIDVYIPGSGRNKTDLEDKLNWIKVQVFPTMQLLADNGYREPLMQLMLDLE